MHCTAETKSVNIRRFERNLLCNRKLV